MIELALVSALAYTQHAAIRHLTCAQHQHFRSPLTHPPPLTPSHRQFRTALEGFRPVYCRAFDEQALLAAYTPEGAADLGPAARCPSCACTPQLSTGLGASGAGAGTAAAASERGADVGASGACLLYTSRRG